MKQEFCHLCKEGGKQCIEVDTKQQVYMEMFHVKCSKCGRPLVS
ncbi:MAG TPA: hypothetical protein VFA69_05720 [Candidatus Nitrosotalea sp.]|nr:hypothetical protein [Candidatus Nitrosotalea sp.]